MRIATAGYVIGKIAREGAQRDLQAVRTEYAGSVPKAPKGEPLDRGLNVAILHIASKLCPTGYDVSPDAPSTYRALRAHLDAGKRMVVYDGGSDGTIYADNEVNYAMRAWHDWCHYSGCNDFSLAGETVNCHMQQAQLVQLYGDCETTRRWCRILEAEVIGQRLYYERHKKYVVDQRAFALHYLANPAGAVETVH